MSVMMVARLVGFATVIFAVSCARATANEYYEVDQNDAVYIAWTQDSSGHLQGQVEIVAMESSGSTQLKTTNAAFTGTRSGSDVSLTFGLLSAFGGATWTGHVGWGSLSLVIPTSGVPQRFTLSAGSFDQFQAAVSRLQGNVATNQTHVALYNAVTEASNHLRQGATDVNSGLAQLREMFPKTPSGDSLASKFPKEWDKMQAAWQKEQDDAHVIPMTCYEKSQVEYDASQVQYEMSQFEYLYGLAQSANSDYNAATGRVDGGIAELQNWAPQFNVRVRDYTTALGQTYNRNAVSAVAPTISSARKSLAYYSTRWSNFRSYIIDFTRRAKQQTDEAKAFPASIACSG